MTIVSHKFLIRYTVKSLIHFIQSCRVNVYKILMLIHVSHKIQVHLSLN